MKTMKKSAGRKRAATGKVTEEKRAQVPSAFSRFMKRSKIQDNEII